MRLLIFLLIVAVILFIGWRQPISYRFMSVDDIFALEHPTPPPTPAPTPTPIPWQWKPNPTDPLKHGALN